MQDSLIVKYRAVLCLTSLCVFLNLPMLCDAKKKETKTISKSTQTRHVETPDARNNRDWGFGLVIGDPTGVTAKYWQNKNVAYEFALGSQLAASGVNAHADYLYHLYVFEDAQEAPIYLGGGIFLGSGSNSMRAGLRGVVGLTYLFEEPFDVFMQLAPNFSLVPSAGFYFTFSIGARLYI